MRLTGALVQEAKAAGYAVETVVLIGGSSRIPLAQRRLQETLPVAPEKWQKQDVAVALGAALHGQFLWGPGSARRRRSPPAPAPEPARPCSPPDPLPPRLRPPPAPSRPIPATGARSRPAGARRTRRRTLSPRRCLRALHCHPPPRRLSNAPDARASAAPSTRQLPAALLRDSVRALGAYLLDVLIIGIVAPMAAAATADAQIPVGHQQRDVLPALCVLMRPFYYGYCWSAGGRTPGLPAVGLR